MLKEFMDVFVETAEQHCNLDSQISLKELPAEGGLYAEPGQGFEVTKYYDKTGIHTLPVLFLCRNEDQIRCIEQLESICNYFARLKEYPKGEQFSWLNAEIAKGVSRVGRDADGVYHYSCILNCKLYF